MSNSPQGLDFGLGETADALRDDGRALRRRRDRAARRRDRPRQRVPARPVAASSASSACSASPCEEEYGGAGMGYLAHVVAMEEISPRLGLGRPVLRRALQPLRQPDPPQRHRGAEAPLPAEADLRRARRRAGDERAGRRLRRGRRCSLRAEKRGDRYVAERHQDVDHQRPRRRRAGGLRQDRPGGRAARHHRLPGREGLQGLLHRAEARQARHARLQHLRAGVRGLRGAGGERARRGRAAASRC